MNATGRIIFLKPNGKHISLAYNSVTDREDMIAIYREWTYTLIPHRSLNRQSEKLYNGRLAEWEAKQKRARMKKVIQKEYANELKVV